MPVSLPLAAYLLIAGVSLHILAFILYRQNRHSPELRLTALVMFALGAASLALAALLWMESRLATTAASTPTQVSMEHTRAVREEP
jgi:hypothetical protein